VASRGTAWCGVAADPPTSPQCGNLASVTDVATKASDQAKTDVQTASERAASASDAGILGSVTKALSEFVAALVRADGGELYLVSATPDDVHLHLTGTCAGCPGATMTRERLLEPAVRGAAPKATVKVTTGWSVPEGALKVE
jgi:Fe-S cluster biogenesis protein NfuA